MCAIVRLLLRCYESSARDAAALLASAGAVPFPSWLVYGDRVWLSSKLWPVRAAGGGVLTQKEFLLDHLGAWGSDDHLAFASEVFTDPTTLRRLGSVSGIEGYLQWWWGGAYTLRRSVSVRPGDLGAAVVDIDIKYDDGAGAPATTNGAAVWESFTGESDWGVHSHWANSSGGVGGHLWFASAGLPDDLGSWQSGLHGVDPGVDVFLRGLVRFHTADGESPCKVGKWDSDAALVGLPSGLLEAVNRSSRAVGAGASSVRRLSDVVRESGVGGAAAAGGESVSVSVSGGGGGGGVGAVELAGIAAQYSGWVGDCVDDVRALTKGNREQGLFRNSTRAFVRFFGASRLGLVRLESFKWDLDGLESELMDIGVGLGLEASVVRVQVGNARRKGEGDPYLPSGLVRRVLRLSGASSGGGAASSGGVGRASRAASVGSAASGAAAGGGAPASSSSVVLVAESGNGSGDPAGESGAYAAGDSAAGNGGGGRKFPALGEGWLWYQTDNLAAECRADLRVVLGLDSKGSLALFLPTDRWVDSLGRRLDHFKNLTKYVHDVNESMVRRWLYSHATLRNRSVPIARQVVSAVVDKLKCGALFIGDGPGVANNAGNFVGVPNGVLEFDPVAGVVNLHESWDQDVHVWRAIPTEYRPDLGVTPAVDELFSLFTGSDDWSALMRLMGRGLFPFTGGVPKLIPYLFGLPNTGKSSAVKCIKLVLGGDIVFPVTAERAADKHGSIPFTRYGIILMDEFVRNPGSISFLNRVTGGVGIHIEHKYADLTAGDPVSTIVCTSNTLQIGADLGLHDRLVILEFLKEIPAAKRDPLYPSNWSESDRSSLLNCLIGGFVDYFASKVIPESAAQKNAKIKLVEANDPLSVDGDSVLDWLVFESGAAVLRRELKKLVDSWAATNGANPVRVLRALYKHLRDSGCDGVGSGNHRAFSGVRLRDSAQGDLDSVGGGGAESGAESGGESGGASELF